MVPEPNPKTPPAHRITKKSIESLEFEKQDLLACIADSKKKNQLQKDIIENNEKEIKEMSAKVKINASKTLKSLDDMKKQVKLLTSLLKKIFTDGQIDKMKHPQYRQPWSNLALQQCIVLYLVFGSTAYKFLIAKGYPFIPVSTLQEHMAPVDFDPGILNDIFVLMKPKVEDLPPHQRIFGIVMDEMAIQPKIEFDPRSESYLGTPTVPINLKTIEKSTKKDPEYVYDVNQDIATHAMNIFWGLTRVSFDPKFVANLLKGNWKVFSYEAVQHKLKNWQKMHFFFVFRPILSLCPSASQPYRLSHINVLRIN